MQPHRRCARWNSCHCANASSPVLTPTRLECGDEQEPMSLAGFSDTYANPDFKLPLTYSCYLIRHGDG
jgi:hypothetical protein